MKTIHLLLLCMIPGFAIAQCLCPDLPAPDHSITSVQVSNVAELQQALLDANTNNGHYEILLADGTYQLSRNLLYISSNMEDLTIRSESGNADSVVIRGNGMTGNVTHIFNVAARKFTAADMTIGWVANHAIQIHGENDADSCLVQNVRFYDIGEQMLKGSGGGNDEYSDDCTVQCCHFEFTDGVASQYYTGGIDTHKGRNWLVANNTFVDIRSPEQRLAEHAIHFWSNSMQTIVENNTIINCDRGIGFGLGDRGHQGGIIRNNFVHTSRDVGIGLETSPETKVYNNTLVTDNYFNSIEYRFDKTLDVHIANNLCDKAISSRNGAQGLVENNYTFRDPDIFVDHANHDYHLAGKISGITDSGLDLVTKDFDCSDRYEHGPSDIGADEWEDFSTSQNDIEISSIKVSPNPARDHVNLQPSHGISQIDLLTSSGQKIHEWQNGFETLTFDLTPGCYVLVIERCTGMKEVHHLVVAY